MNESSISVLQSLLAENNLPVEWGFNQIFNQAKMISSSDLYSFVKRFDIVVDERIQMNGRESQIFLEFLRQLDLPKQGEYNTMIFRFLDDNNESIYPYLNDSEKIEIKRQIVRAIEYSEPNKARIYKEPSNSFKFEYNIYYKKSIFPIIRLLNKNLFEIDVQKYKRFFLSYLTFCLDDNVGGIFHLIGPLDAKDIQYLKDLYLNATDDRIKFSILNTIYIAQKLKIKEFVPLFKELIKTGEEYNKESLLEAICDLELSEEYLCNFMNFQFPSKKPNFLYKKAIYLLIIHFSKKEYIQLEMDNIKNLPNKEDNNNYFYYTVQTPLSQISDKQFLSVYTDLFAFAMNFGNLYKESYSYFNFLIQIVFQYFDNLKIYKDYKVYLEIERNILKNQDSVWWSFLLSKRLQDLKQS